MRKPAASKAPATPATKTAPAKTAAAPRKRATAAVKAAVKTAAKPVAKVVKAAARPVAKPAPQAPVKAVKAVKAVKPKVVKAPVAEEQVREKAAKSALVRDSFTMPAHEYEVLGKVKKACLKAGFEIKKSELLRIGVALISQMDMATLQRVLGDLPQLKTGRPKKV